MQLRPYQIESIEDLREGFRNGHKRQVLAAPTGSGKSVMMLDIIRSAGEKGSRILFICERRVLVEQFSKHLDSIGIDHGVMMAGHWRHRMHVNVQVASAQTLERMESWPAFDVVFIDELHACMRKSVINIIKTRPNLRIIGATATPFHPSIVEHFSSVTSVTSMRELVESGSLVPFRVFVAKEIDTTGVKVLAGEWQKGELEKRGQQIVGDIVTDYMRISNEVFGGYRKTICFSCGVAHGADLVNRFAEQGINAVQLSYKDEDEYKVDVLADFARPDTDIQVLVSAQLLTRGYDQPDVEYVILASPLKKSFSSHVQMVGRGARPHEGKEFCVIQDNSGNWMRFQDSWDSLYHNGVKELTSAEDKKPRKEPTEQEKKAAKCPSCGQLWPGQSDTCSHCGFVRVRKSAVIEVPGEMFELSSKPKKDAYSMEYKTAFYAQLLGYAEEKGYKPGFAFWKFQDKFGFPPEFTGVLPEKAGEDVRGFVLSRIIAASNGWRKRSA